MFSKIKSYYNITRLNWVKIPCPICNIKDCTNLLNRDRYLFDIKLSICEKCSLVFTSKNLSKNDLNFFYKKYYRYFYENIDSISHDYLYNSKDYLKASSRFSEIKKIIPNFKNILEIGCGLGFFLNEAKKENKKILGFEPGETFYNFIKNNNQIAKYVINDDFLNEAKKENKKILGFEPGETFYNFIKNNNQIAKYVINDDFLNYSEKNIDVDLVVMFHVLEHLEDPNLILKKIFDKTNENVNLVVEVPDIDQCDNGLGLMNYHFGHRWYFSLYSLNKILKKNKFYIYKITKSINDGIYPGYIRVFANKINNNNELISDGNIDYINNLKKKIKSSTKIGKFKNTSYLYRLLSLLKY